jgi:1-acyl-sn-glycerol-3-phosphate acyltransferase
MRSLYTKLVVAAATLWYGSVAIVSELLGVRHGQGTIFDTAPRDWARAIARAAGMRIITHGREAIDASKPHVYVCNHVSIMDIPAVLHAVPDHGFVAKRELSRIPFFGAAARAVGVVFIDRENRKSAFAAYEEAADKVRAGRSVIVFPEGTRGATYALRPFKKGPFVLAIRSGVPIIPVIIHGTIEVTPNGTTDVTPGEVHVHLLAPVATAGLSYDERNALADRVRERMAEAMESHYGVPRAISTSSDVPEQGSAVSSPSLSI